MLDVDETDGPLARADRRRAVLVVPDYLPSLGGTTTQTRLHALELARRGWDVTVLTRRVGWGGSEDRIEGISVRRVGPPGHGRISKSLVLPFHWWWLVRRRRTVSVLSVVMDADLAVCGWAAGLGSSTVVTWVTLGDPTRQLTGWKGEVRRRALGGSKQVVLTSSMRDEITALGFAETAVVEVPVDLSWFRPPTPAERDAARAALGIGSGFLVAFIGHLQPRKAVERLLVATKLLRDKGIDVNVVLVGGPVETEDRVYLEGLERYVATSLSDGVIFVGPQRDVRPFLFAADLLCLPSEREGMPNVLLEAMACGVTCVAPRSAGGDLLAGGAGCVPSSNAPADLAASMEALLSDPGTREEKAQRGFELVRGSHRIETIIDRYEELFGS